MPEAAVAVGEYTVGEYVHSYQNETNMNFKKNIIFLPCYPAIAGPREISL